MQLRVHWHVKENKEFVGKGEGGPAGTVRFWNGLSAFAGPTHFLWVFNGLFMLILLSYKR